MNENGFLNLKRFEEYMKELAKFDFDKFEEHAGDLRWFAGKRNQNKAKEQKVRDCSGTNEVKPKFCCLV